jgi:two-component system CAI-1 autoinducer sensor kinase/phosphatase CqsS
MGVIGVLVLPTIAYIEDIVGDPLFDTFWVRAMCGLMALPILFWKELGIRSDTYLDLIWIISSTSCTLVCFGLILTINAALTPAGALLNPIWVYQYAVGLFIFILLTRGVFFILLSWALSLVPQTLAVILLEQPNFEALYHAWVYPAPIYLTAILVGGFAYRNSELVQREKLKAASAIGSYIAHELRTPLASIRSRARFSANALARETSRSLDETDVSGVRKSADLDRSVESLKVIQEEVEYANTLIDMLLLNTKDSLLPDNVGEQNNASEIVAESVRRYPFSNSRERESVFTEIIDDFTIKGERLLIVHVVFNLLKNAVLYMQRKPNGQTHIRVLVEGNRGVIEVTDTGPGIPRMIRKRIFERFFTTLESGRGTGIGLSFCKMVMEGLGGEITVDSTEGEFTTFRLLFPIEAKS